MINLLYYSHTVVPAHLGELETLGLLERDEQVLVALDGVLLDGNGKRLSGPTLHDYCLITTLRILLWARDYGGHICYAFPLAELASIQGQGLDPLHAQITFTFVALDDAEEDESEQRFSLALLPVANLQPGLALLRNASETARDLLNAGISAREAGPDILAILSEQIYGHVDGLRPGESPYRWPGASGQQLTPVASFNQDAASLPPERIYAASRLARSAWDTLRRSIRDADLPFDLNALNTTSLRDLTETIRAVNELMQTVATNPSAQQMAMAFLNRQTGRSAPEPAPYQAPPSPAPSSAPTPEPQAQGGATPPYHEIPFRNRERSGSATVAPSTQSAAPAPAPATPDRREIPLRRRGPTTSGASPRPPVSISGSGDADGDEARS
ncbi:hypothetical protein OSCT_1086 [Oscillochloris trichoides DG-6]|uniref:Uncharacterized protein n=1 Tax=Oscillochloris trichoides DG-6 TaxID=765420 RepID=E1ICN5_9CHLR|nr:hypothetical protein OSCT_1086 [Oscillochloris trichoides DG-6]